MALESLIDELICCICKDLYTDPVTLLCGHNYCLTCITKTWDRQDDRESSCPECRRIYRRRPELKINVGLRKLAENVHDNQPKISCSRCQGGVEFAVKSCLLCEVSLCRYHLRLHEDQPEDHLITEPTSSFSNRICVIHRKLLSHYCCDDQEWICASCLVGEKHRNHKLESLFETVKKKRAKLRRSQIRIKENELRISQERQDLVRWSKEMQDRAMGMAQRSSVLLEEARTKMNELEKRFQSAVSKQKEQIAQKVMDKTLQLDRKQQELSRDSFHIDNILKSLDHFVIIQEELHRPELYQMEPGEHMPLGTEERDYLFVSDLSEDEISATLTQCFTNIVSLVKEPINKTPVSGVLMVLDENTAGNYVTLSDDLKTASWSSLSYDRPDLITRFQVANQVLSTKGFHSGQHYLEVEASAKGVWIIGLAYPSIDRGEYESFIGRNTKSWGLYKSYDHYCVIHDSKEVALTSNISSQKFRIFLDYGRGQLTFYELTTPLKNLHTFNTTFTEPLHAAFSVWGDGKLTIKN